MRILMISPQPFFEARGAPFCVYQHIKALLTLGYEVDLVTYHLGKDLHMPGLRIFRVPRLPFIHSIKPGLSLAKVPLDLAVFCTAFWHLCSKRYHYLHTHEEGALLGLLLSAIFGCKHLYAMHCDLADLVASSFEHDQSLKLRLLVRVVNFVQQLMLRGADAVIAFYPVLETKCRQIAPTKPIALIPPPAVDEHIDLLSAADRQNRKQMFQVSDGPILVYTGTLEKYQGLDILLQSVQAVCAMHPRAHYLIIGGKSEQVEQLQRRAQQLGVAEHVTFMGQRPVEEISCSMAIADVLLSPRSKGTHTPLKLYTYLRSGKPILATSIVSHTQILTTDMALLVSPTPEALAQGTLTLLAEPEIAHKRAEHARQIYEQWYSWPVFLEKMAKVYQDFTNE